MTKYEKLFNDKLGELMKDAPFGIPEEMCKLKFNEHVYTALTFHTEETLDITLDEYERVVNNATDPLPREWFMPEMYIALKAVRSILPKDCGYSLLNWIGFKRHYYDLGTQWDSIAWPYIEEAKAFVQNILNEDNETASRMAGLKPKKSKLITL